MVLSPRKTTFEKRLRNERRNSILMTFTTQILVVLLVAFSALYCIIEIVRRCNILIKFPSLQACPEDVTSIDSIRAALGVGLVPNLASGLRQKTDEKTADEKTGSVQPGESAGKFNSILKKLMFFVNFATNKQHCGFATTDCFKSSVFLFLVFKSKI